MLTPRLLASCVLTLALAGGCDEEGGGGGPTTGDPTAGGTDGDTNGSEEPANLVQPCDFLVDDVETLLGRPVTAEPFSIDGQESCAIYSMEADAEAGFRIDVNRVHFFDNDLFNWQSQWDPSTSETGMLTWTDQGEVRIVAAVNQDPPEYNKVVLLGKSVQTAQMVNGQSSIDIFASTCETDGCAPVPAADLRVMTETLASTVHDEMVAANP